MQACKRDSAGPERRPCPLACTQACIIPVDSAADDQEGGGGTAARFEGVQGFIRAAEQMGVPRDYMFNVADLDADGREDRPCVVNCLLWLKLLHESNTAGNDLTSKASSPLRGVMPRPAAPAHDPQPQQHSNRSSASGVTKLMQECTVLLKAKMSYSSSTQQTMTPRSTDAFSFDAVGPVLESVLGGLTQVRQSVGVVAQGVRACASRPRPTEQPAAARYAALTSTRAHVVPRAIVALQEYERRLHAKDTEIIAATEKMHSVTRQMEGMQAQLRQAKEELAAAQEAAAAAASQATAAQNEEMQVAGRGRRGQGGVGHVAARAGLSHRRRAAPAPRQALLCLPPLGRDLPCVPSEHCPQRPAAPHPAGAAAGHGRQPGGARAAVQGH